MQATRAPRPTFREFLQENRKALAEHFTVLCALALCTIFLWTLESPKMLATLGFHLHFLGEWVFFAQMGKLLASLKHMILPAWTGVLGFSLLGVLAVGSLIGFTVSSVAFALLFTSPMPIRYCLQKTIQKVTVWRKTCVQESNN